MSQIHTVGSVTLTAGTPTPIYTGAANNVLTAASFSIVAGGGVSYNGNAALIAKIVLSSTLPTTGYEPGKQVSLYGFTTATYFNGLKVTVVSNNVIENSFTFSTTHAAVGSTSDAGSVFAQPVERFRVARVECAQTNSTNLVYVGDQFVSSTRYAAALLLTGQISYVDSGDNIDASTIWLDTNTTGSKVEVTLVY